MKLQKLLEEIKRMKELSKMDVSYFAHKLEGVKVTVETVDRYVIMFCIDKDLILWQEIKKELDI